jgi:hypothetical protein
MRQGKLSELIDNLARCSDLDEWSVEDHFREIIDLVCVFLQFWPSTEYDISAARSGRIQGSPEPELGHYPYGIQK